MSIVIPENIADVNEPPYRGSFQQLFAANIGHRVRIDFLIGSSTTTTQTGMVYAVTSQYVVLRNLSQDTFVACDNFSIKFVTFL